VRDHHRGDDGAHLQAPRRGAGRAPGHSRGQNSGAP
jgi:hypothetical protein